jgi:hypothetical protein
LAAVEPVSRVTGSPAHGRDHLGAPISGNFSVKPPDSRLIGCR